MTTTKHPIQPIVTDDMLPVKKQSPAHDDAAPDVEQEPVAWIISHPRFCGKFTDDKKIAEYWESEEQGCTAPLFLHPQPAPDFAKLVEAEQALASYRRQGGDL